LENCVTFECDGNYTHSQSKSKAHSYLSFLGINKIIALKKQLKKYLAGEDNTYIDTLSPSLKTVIPMVEEVQPQDLPTDYVFPSLRREVDVSASPRVAISKSCFLTTQCVSPKSDETVISNSESPITTNSNGEEINYKITVICLETLSHLWYSSPNSLGWR
jgi:RNA polymerase sigma-70 factor (ECF subfamily)